MAGISRIAGGGAAIVAAAATMGLVATHEGLRTETYADPALGWAVPTVCFGETGAHVQRGQNYTVDQCMRMLDTRLRSKWVQLSVCITRDVELHQAIAILSLADNAGVAAICRSTLVRLLNAGESPGTWCAQFSRWTYAGGRELPGLVKRRAAERALCEGMP